MEMARKEVRAMKGKIKVVQRRIEVNKQVRKVFEMENLKEKVEKLEKKLRERTKKILEGILRSLYSFVGIRISKIFMRYPDYCI
jgi:peptidoglycan hydrolase CwlO-like protein